MDILKPYIGLDINVNHNKLSRQYYDKINELKKERNQVLLNYHMSLFKNFKFRGENIKRYMENIDDLCLDICLINSIKQEYEMFNNIARLEVGTEDDNHADIKYSYKEGITPEFDNIFNTINEIVDDVQSNNCFSDICTLSYKEPNGSYCSLIDYEFEYTQDYYGEYIYFIDSDFYPIVLELEKLINSKSKEFKELIIKEYNERY